RMRRERAAHAGRPGAMPTAHAIDRPRGPALGPGRDDARLIHARLVRRALIAARHGAGDARLAAGIGETGIARGRRWRGVLWWRGSGFRFRWRRRWRGGRGCR